MARKKASPAIDPYQELGVPLDAGTAEIKSAFRTKAKKAHPDRGGTSEQFERLKKAHLILSNPARRAKFDATGEIDPCEAFNDSAAFEEISGALAHLLMQQMNVLDLKAGMLSLFRQKQDHIQKQAAPLRRAIARAEKAGKRFTRRGKGENMLARMLDWQRGQWIDVVAGLDKQADALKRAEKIVSEYDFEAMPAENSFLIPFNTTSSTIYFS